MAKRSFSESAFNEAVGKVESGDKGDFPTIAKGTYIADVSKCYFEHTDGGAEMAKFGFQIDAEDESYPNQYIWVNECLVKKNGEDNDIGLKKFVVMLNQLTDGHFDKPSFASPETRDTEIEKLLGTRVKIHVTPKQVGEYTNYDVKIRALLENVYAKTNNQQLDDDTVDETNFNENESIDTTDTISDKKEEKEEKEEAPVFTLEKGMKIIIRTKVGENIIEEVGTCIEFIDTGDENSMIVFDSDVKSKAPKTFKPSDIDSFSIQMDESRQPVWNKEYLAQLAEETKIVKKEEVEEIEELEEEPEWELVVKGAAAFMMKDKRYSGLVLSIDEDAGKAVIAVNGKKLRVPISKLEKP